jgi:hypothetical protein
VQEVLTRASAGRGVLVRVDDTVQALDVLRGAGIEARLDDDDDHAIIARVEPEQAGRINQLLGDHRVWATELRPIEATLEDVFLELTGEQSEPGPAAGDPSLVAQRPPPPPPPPPPGVPR